MLVRDIFCTVTWFLSCTLSKLKNCWRLYCTELCLEIKKVAIHSGTQGPSLIKGTVLLVKYLASASCSLRTTVLTTSHFQKYVTSDRRKLRPVVTKCSCSP